MAVGRGLPPPAGRRKAGPYEIGGTRMGIRTGRAFLESMRDDRQIWIDGERIADVTTDRRFAGAAQSMAELYEMQHDPEIAERLSFASPSSGERVGLSFVIPETVEDLVRRRDMVKLWAD